MAKSPRNSRNTHLTIGLDDNYDRDRRSLSPIGGISNNEIIELKEKRSTKPEAKDDAESNFIEIFDKTQSNDNDDAPRQISVTSFHSEEEILRKAERSARKRARKEKRARANTATDDGIALENENARQSSADLSLGSKQTTDLDLDLSADSGASSLRCPSTASGYNDDEDMDYFCADHMQLVTNRVLREEHFECQNIVPVHEWAEAQTIERQRKNTESLLKRIDVFAGIMIEERADMKTALDENKEHVTEDFLDMMEDLITHLLTKQKEFTEKLDGLHEKNVKNINDQIKRCTMVQRETSSCLKQLSDCNPGTEEYQQLRKKIQDKCPVYEEILRRDFNASTRLDYEFVPDPNAEMLHTKLKSIGDVIARPAPSKLPGFLSQSDKSDMAVREIDDISHNDGRSAQDTNSCCFTGCTYISGGRLLLTDWSNMCVKMFNNKGVLTHRYDLPNNPWDIKMIDDSTVVVTVPGEKRICILGYTKDGMGMIDSFETDCECWGVVPIEDKFAVTCDPWSKNPSVKIYKKTGKLVAFFQKDSKDKNLFKYPEHIATDINQSTIFVSDSRSHMVTAITLSGRILFRYVHEKLESPAGVTTDLQSNLYVCGKDSQNVHQINSHGQHLRILFDQNDIISPRAIGFEPNGERLVITDGNSETSDEFLTAKFA